MKRLIIILVTSLLSIAGWAQMVEMFHLEQSFDEPGVSKHMLTRRATNWYVHARNEFHTVYEYDEKGRGTALEFAYYKVPAGVAYRDMSIRFRIMVTPVDGQYTISLDRLFVTCYKGRKTVFLEEQIPASEDRYPDDRLWKDRLHISSVARYFAKARFDELVPFTCHYMGFDEPDFYLTRDSYFGVGFASSHLNP